jgi:two-component system cell cycle sensor histidine kinase PleC
MLSFIRYLAFIVFAGIVAGSIYAGSYVQEMIEADIVAPILTKQGEKIGSSFEKLVWKKNSEALIALSERPAAVIDQSNEYQMLRKRIAILLASASVHGFTLYTANQQKLYSTYSQPPALFVGDYNQFFGLAKQGNTQVRTVTDVTYNDDKGQPIEGSLLHILVPIYDGQGIVTAIVELSYDVAGIKSHLQPFQYLLSLVVLVISICVYLVVWLLSSRAQSMIAKQHEVNKELAEARERAENESQEKSKFLANISHELRTPLNAIIGFSDIIKTESMGPMGNEQYRDYINDINSSGVHLLSLINDILDYSKAEAGKLEVDTVDVDLTKTIKNSMRLVLPRAQEAKVTLVENIPEKHIIMTADPKRMKQILLNLLSNAVKFTPEKGEVKLSAWEKDGKITIEVADTGIGISHKNIAKAMSTFGQVDSSLSRRYEGTGLGLPFTRKLTLMMGGTFDIQSEEGLGTTITLVFPSKTEGGEVAAPKAKESSSEKAPAEATEGKEF